MGILLCDTKQENMKAFAILLFSLAMVWHPAAKGQDSKKKVQKEARISALIDSQSYVFKAQSATPTSGRLRQLTSEYDLTIMPTTVVSYQDSPQKRRLGYFNQTKGCQRCPANDPHRFRRRL